MIANPLRVLKKKKEKPVVEEKPKAQIPTTFEYPKVYPTFETPKLEPETIPKQEENPQPKVYRDEKGYLSGVEIGGKTYLGLSPDEVNQMIEGERKKTELPAGAVEMSQSQEQKRKELGIEENKRTAYELFQKYKGQPLPPEVVSSLNPSQIDWYQALASGVTGAAGGFVSGLVGKGIAAATGVGTLPALLLTAGTTIGGLYLGIRSNIKAQIGGELSGRTIELGKGEQNLRMIITDINGGGNPIQDTQLFYENLNALKLSQAELEKDTSTFYAKGTGTDGTPELVRYDIFFNRTLPLLERELNQAILNPNPNRILVEEGEVLSEENEKE